MEKIKLQPNETVAFKHEKGWKYGRVKGISLDGQKIMLECLDNDEIQEVYFDDVYRLANPKKQEKEL